MRGGEYKIVSTRLEAQSERDVPLCGVFSKSTYQSVRWKLSRGEIASRQYITPAPRSSVFVHIYLTVTLNFTWKKY